MIDFRDPDAPASSWLGAELRLHACALGAFLLSTGAALLFATGLGALLHAADFEVFDAGEVETLTWIGWALVTSLAAAWVSAALLAHAGLWALLAPDDEARRAHEATLFPGESADSWLEHLDDQEKPLAVLAIDEESFQAPFRQQLVCLVLVTLLGLACLTACASLMAAGSMLMERTVWITLLVAPALCLLTPGLAPPLRYTLFPWVGLACALPALIFTIEPAVLGAVASDPLLQGAALALIAAAGWLIQRAVRRPRQALLVTSAGVRRARHRGLRGWRLAPPTQPSILRLAPGPNGSTWDLTEGTRGGRPFTPCVDDPQALAARLQDAGLSVEVSGTGGRCSIRAEVLGSPGLALAPLGAGAAIAAVSFPLLHLGLHLGLDVIAEIAPSMKTPAGAQQMLDGCERTVEHFPDSLVALAFQRMIELERGNPRARALGARTHQILDSRRWPGVVQGQTVRLQEQVDQQEESGCYRPAPEGPARGWEPAGPALQPFRAAMAAASIQPYRVWGHEWRDWVDHAREAHRLAPRVPGPAQLLAWMHLRGPAAGPLAEHPSRVLAGEVDTEAPLGSLLDLVHEDRRQLVEWLRATEAQAAFVGLADLVEEAYPAWFWRTLQRRLAELPSLEARRQALGPHLATLRRGRWLAPPDSRPETRDGPDCRERHLRTEIRQLMDDPPTKFEGTLRIWRMAEGEDAATAATLERMLAALSPRAP